MCAAVAATPHSPRIIIRMDEEEGVKGREDSRTDSPEAGEMVSTILTVENDTSLLGRVELASIETMADGSTPVFTYSFPVNTEGGASAALPSKTLTILHNCDFEMKVTFQDEELREHRSCFPISITGERVHTIALSRLNVMPAILISSADDRRYCFILCKGLLPMLRKRVECMK